MIRTNHELHVRSLGGLALSQRGVAVTAPWPDKITKELFCSLLSPLDICITFDRLSRSLLGAPLTARTSERLEMAIDSLIRFTSEEMGVSDPLLVTPDAVGFKGDSICIDAHQFFETALKGLSNLSKGEKGAALQHVCKAMDLYEGDFLPGMNSRIIVDTREELAGLHKVFSQLLRPARPVVKRSCHISAAC